jgi:hypothetical protein
MTKKPWEGLPDPVPQADDAPTWHLETCSNGQSLRRCRECKNFNNCVKTSGCMRKVKARAVRKPGSHP